MALLIFIAVTIVVYLWSAFAFEKDLKTFHLQAEAKWLLGILIFLGTSILVFEPLKLNLFPFIASLVVLAIADFKYQSVRILDLIGMSLTLIPLISWSSFIQIGLIASMMLIALIVLKTSLKFIYKKDAFGAADIWVMVAILIGLGGRSALIAIYVSIILSACIGLGLIILSKRSKHSTLPFIPFLFIGTIISVFFSNQILNLYNAITMI